MRLPTWSTWLRSLAGRPGRQSAVRNRWGRRRLGLELLEDRCVPAVTQYDSGPVNLDLADPGTTTSEIVIADPGTVADVNVQLDVSHPG